MTDKITLATVGSIATNPTSAVTIINDNFTTIQTAFDNTLSRDGTTPNQMTSGLDMNSNRILNLPAPIGSTEPLRLGDIPSTAGPITVNAIPAGGTTGQSLQKTSNSDYAVGWGSEVISVGLAMPSDFTVTGSPVTSTGTLTASYTALPTGSGLLVRNNTPTFVSPILGTPTSGTLTNCTGLPVSSGISGLATGVSTFLSTPSSANLASAITDETGSGNLVFGTAPSLSSPTLTTPTVTSAGTTYNGSTSGTTIVKASATASGTLTFPAATDTLIAKATTDTLTNKTFNTAGTGNVFQINGTSVGTTAPTFRTAVGCSATPVVFRATKGGTDQTGIANSSFTALTFTTVDINQGSFYNSGTNTWTPPAGAVQISVAAASNGFNMTAGALYILTVYKNGSRFKDGYAACLSTGTSFSNFVNFWDVASGTDTYSVEVNIATNGGATVIWGTTSLTYFSGIAFPA